MGKTIQKFARFLNDESGQTTTEYVLILAVVVMVVMKFKTIIIGKLEGMLNNTGNLLDQATQQQ